MNDINQKMKNMNEFIIWKTVTVGTYKNIEELKQAITDAGFRIGDWANDVLNSPNFSIAVKPTKINLVKVTPADLGFPRGVRRLDLYKKAFEFGLNLCPLEVGPQLRLQYHGQPKLESIQIAMKSQKDSENHESIFRVVHGGDDYIWLVGDHKHPDDFWKANEFFVFMKK